MKKYIYIFVFILPFNLYGQPSLSLHLGYGLYKMKDMERLQSEITTDFPVEMKRVMSFPSYWYYELSIQNFSDNDILFGGSMSYGSTAGRLSYSDYSGSVNFDQLLVFYGLGASIGKWVRLNNEKTIIAGDLKPGLIFTNLQLQVDQNIWQQASSEVFTFQSINIVAQPSIRITHPLGNRIILSGHFGYHLTVIPGKLKYGGDIDGGYLTDKNNKLVYTDWSGLRVSIGIGYFIGGQKTF